MPYETLIAALLEEGDAKCKAIVRKARAEADRLINEAAAAAETLAREADLHVQQQGARQRVEILSRATLSERQILLQAKQEVVEAVWRRGTERALALIGPARARVLRALLDDLLTSAPPGSLKVVIDGGERASLVPYLQARGLPFEEQHRDDLLLGVELDCGGERLRSSFATRLAKAKPELTIELNRLLFSEQQASGEGQ
ncbi:MAG: hypothetical protein HY581_09075 [Nitrospirae bacterium]|nr:hypothetical protein [Nitrospirota bacterium]